MPRLPTMRVIGSHAISTSSLPWLAVSRRLSVAVISSPPSPGASRAGGQLRARPAPLGLPVQGVRGDAAQAPDGGAVQTDRGGGELAAGRLVHERHELVGEARHRAADADAADVRATA